jgi:hypothetical protein
MAKKPISYTSRDFESIKNDLENYAKRYYPSTFKDFSEASFGSLMLDLVAYVGDQLSFYTDYQANESFLDSSIEFSNIVRNAEQLGYKMPGAPMATGICAFYVLIPASSTVSGPDLDYIPILKKNTLVSSEGGVIYTLNEDVDFTDSSNEVTVAAVDTATGVPTSFAIKAYGQVLSGQSFSKSIAVGSYQRFLRIPLAVDNVVEIISVTDSQGNEYKQVEYLSQDIVLKQVKNYSSDSRTAVPYLMRVEPVPRRFQTEFDSFGDAFLQFGFGSAENLTTSVIADPADVVLDVSGRNYVSDITFDPSNLIESDKFGVVPVNTSLNIIYRANTAASVNASVSSVNNVVDPRFIFKNQSTLNQNSIAAVVQSVQVDNEEPILGDTQALTAQEVKERAYASFASQSRAVSRSDYISLSYRMPSKFGRVKRVNIVQDKDSIKRNLNMYVLSENSQGDLVASNTTLKNNLKTWLNQYKMINDTIDILDGKIINYGINFEVIPELDVNRYQLLDACVNRLIDELSVKKNIGDPVYISEIYKILNDVSGVIDTTNVELVSKSGGVYSSFYYDMQRNISDDGRFLIIPEDAVAEILLPTKDISGAIK